MRNLAGCVVGLVLLLPQAGLSQAVSGTVVELFTSQGCSSCPPADALMQDLADMPGVIALSLHVDYWDYLGWKDDFALPGFSDRQRAYAAAMGASTIYTPQMIVGGVDQAVGSDPALIADMIRRHQAGPKGPELTLVRQGERVQIGAQAVDGLSDDVRVYLVRYRPRARVVITHGENAGRTIDYANIVTSWSRIGSWDGQDDLALTVAAAGEEGVVVILQDEGPGRIWAAAALR